MSATEANGKTEWAHATLGRLSGDRGQSLAPAKTPDKEFELYSVPSFPNKRPEIVRGEDVGSNKQLVEPRSVLLCKINPRINRAWVVGDFTRHTKIASTEWIVFPPTDEVVPEFLCYYLQQNAVRDFLAHNASGVGGSLMRVKPSTLRDFPFEYPNPKQQRRIVAEIEKQFTRLDAGVAALLRVQAKLKRYRAAVLKAACEGRLVPTEAELAKIGSRKSKFEAGKDLLVRILSERRQNWQGRAKYREAAQPDSANLQPLPQGWTWALIEQLGDVQLGRQRSPKNVSKDYPTKYVRAANITEQGINVSDVLEMEFSPAERERFTLRDGDILLSEASGSPSQVGKPAVWRGELPLCCFQNTVLRLRPVIVGAKYVLLVFKHFYANSVFAKVAGGVGINHLGAEKFSAIPFPLPPLPEQARIVDEAERRLSVVEELEAVVSANIQRAIRLRQSILQCAFNGYLLINKRQE